MKSVSILRSICSKTTYAYLLAFTASSAIAADKSIVPQSTFFGGLGGGWSSGSFYNQDVYGKGTSYSPPYGMHTAQIGSAAGSTGLKLDAQSALAPVIQAGYFQHFSDSQWMRGGKFSYSYWGIGSAKSDLQIPQAGGFTEGGSYTPFTGNYLVQSYRQTINQQISLIPFVGRSFERNYLYLGVGPTTVQTKTLIEDITGYENVAVIPTTPTGVGLGEKYSTTQWLFGGVVMIGATYFIDPTWFVDINYAYAITGTTTSSWGGSWTDTDLNRSSVTRTGTNTGTTSGSVNTQALAISINKTF
ncbi:MAG: hypothetical protein NTW08_04490 [Gammaproteobacteria bacterium]|nr:hypothetical protein [Gammaproteobacteria bacterium]